MYFSSGVYVRADVFEWGLNVQVESSLGDFNHVTGLCGFREVSGYSRAANEGLPASMNDAGKWR